MAKSNTGTSDEQLFIGLAADLITQSWVAMGKIKNPLSDKMEPNLPAAALIIDMLDMLSRKTEGHRSEEEEKLLTENLKQLKLNYVAEAEKADKASPEDATDDADSDSDEEETSGSTPAEIEEPTDD